MATSSSTSLTPPTTTTSNTAGTSSSPDLISVLLRSHNHPYPLFSAPTTDHFTPFHLHLDPPTAQIGFIPAHVLQEILKPEHAATFVHQDGRIALSRRLDSFQARSDALDSVVRSWRANSLFKDALDGWREEKYAIYSSDRYPFHSWERRKDEPHRQPAFELERAACALFGVVTFGVHLNAFTIEETGTTEGETISCGVNQESLRVWIPRRSATKATWPNYLDNSVAGGITSGDTPFESILRECEEEASLDADLIRPHICPAGVVTYVYRTSPLGDAGGGYLQPEVQYIYDLLLPSPDQLSPLTKEGKSPYIPTPNDGEAHSFTRLSIPEILALLKRGEFKPNCALVMLDFMVRKGIIKESDRGVGVGVGVQGFVEMQMLLHRDLGLPMP